MKKIKKAFYVVAVICLSFLFVPSIKTADADFNYNTVSEIVMDAYSGRILYGNNFNEKKYMASTTKILTAIAVLENCDTSAEVTVTDKTVGVEGSSIYLEKGEVLTVKDLLYGLMLRSGNDCAETLAVFCSGSIKGFADLMNETAEKTGAKNSHFVTPHGLHSDDHYTTAKDLALISRYAMQNPVFKEIVSATKAVIPFTTRNTTRVLYNKNKLLKSMDGANGIKTGYTKKAGRCLVASCERNGMQLISVVLNCAPMFERSKEMMENCFSVYSMEKVLSCEEIFAFIPIENTDRKCGVYLKKDVILPLTEKEREHLKTVADLPNFIPKGTKRDTEIGKIKIYSENNLLFEEKLFTIIDV